MINRLAELRRKKENGEGGFTLIELLVVVVIIGILMAIAVPLYLNYRKGANDKTAQSDLRSAVTALEQCQADSGAYPTTTAGVTSCSSVKARTGTTFTYTPGTGSYQLITTNSGGSKFYCYNSANGGSIKDVAGTSATC